MKRANASALYPSVKLLWVCLVCAACTADDNAVCGDGTRDSSEQCDDGNVADGDGCSAQCLSEIPAGCGDGVVAGTEQCDGSGETATCNVNCTLAACGDAIRNVAAGEACDDGNLTNFDGCSNDCHIELPPSCGDGNQTGSEQCDDGNNVNGDGCSASCTIEAMVCGVGALACGGSVTSTTANAMATNAFATYSCLGNGMADKSGPEMVYDFVPTATGIVDANLEGTGTSDVIVVEANATCGIGTCVAGGHAFAEFMAVAGHHYLIIVDSNQGTTSPFYVNLYCP